MLLALLLFVAAPTWAQQVVTVKQINEISQANIDAIKALGTAVTDDDAGSLMFNALSGTEVQITAVVMSDPLNSGLGNESGSNPGFPSRIHVYMRDVAAATEGNAGMGIQVVDGDFLTTGLDGVLVGDVVQVVGTVSPFNETMQIAPSSVTVVGAYNDATFNLPDSILQPETLASTADANASQGDGLVLPNWDNLQNLRGMYVRIEGAKIIDRDISSDRPNWSVSTDDGVTVLNFYDTSLRYRNDRNGGFYTDAGYNARTTDFVPPAIGSTVNIQGFLALNGDNGSGRSANDNLIMSINPFVDSDLEVTEAPPTVSAPTTPTTLPTASGTFTASATAEAAATRTLTNVEFVVTYSDNPSSPTRVAANNTGGNTYEATLTFPSADGVFMTYALEATDNEGGTTTGASASTRVITTFDDISDIQQTADGGVGASPFDGLSLTGMDLTAVVTAIVPNDRLITLQDDPNLGPWSGIFLQTSNAADLAVGDEINITAATVSEDFGAVTTLNDVTYTKTGNTVTYGPLTVTTDVLTDPGTAEAHQAMILRFENVTIINNDTGFGEWSFSSDGTSASAIEADDRSDLIPSDFSATTFTNGSTVGFIQGVWWFSFGEFKLVPQDPATDIGDQSGSTEPPLVGTPNTPDALPTAGGTFTATATAEGVNGATIASAAFVVTLSDGSSSRVDATAGSDNTWSATLTLPTTDETFVTYVLEATDSFGNVGTGGSASTRVITTFDDISDIQQTADGGEGDSPFDGFALTGMDLTAVVTAIVPNDRLIALQDDPNKGPWSGIFLETSNAGDLAVGDEINVTAATIDENFGVTTLEDVTYTKTGNTADYGYLTVPTTVLTDEGTAEAHQAMLLRFENVTIIDNDTGFGEWSFSSDGMESGAIEADDRSDLIGSDFSATTFTNGVASSKACGGSRLANSNSSRKTLLQTLVVQLRLAALMTSSMPQRGALLVARVHGLARVTPNVVVLSTKLRVTSL